MRILNGSVMMSRTSPMIIIKAPTIAESMPRHYPGLLIPTVAGPSV